MVTACPLKKLRKYNEIMAEAWRGGIGKYPPNPEGLGNTLRPPEALAAGEGGYCLTLQDEEGIFQYLLAMLQPLTL